jgi:acetyl esterase/lipase
MDALHPRAAFVRIDACAKRGPGAIPLRTEDFRMPLPRNAIRAIALAMIALLASGCERVLFRYLNRGLAPPAESVVFDAGRGLALDVYRARGAAPGKAPVVVFFYGGAWQRGERGQYRFVGERLAANGIVAIVADYRTWPRAGFPDFMDDAARAVAWARAHAAEQGGDPQRLFLAGHSAGAQIAALLGTDGRYLRAAGIDVRDIAGVIGLSGPYDFAIGGVYARIFGPPAQWPRAQAVNFVDGDEPPFLLVHGDHDRTVEWRNSVELADRLRARGEAVTLLVLPGGSHFATVSALYDPKRGPAVLPAILDFVRAPGDPR